MSHEINAVNVYSIEEERLRFRVIIAFNAETSGQLGRGAYDVNIPIPTSFTNSHEYSSCRIKCENFTASPDSALATPCWGDSAGVVLKQQAIELQLNTPTSQTTGSYVSTAAERSAHGNIEVSGFKQIIPGQIVNIGDALTWTLAPTSLGWLGVISGGTGSVLSANPFGQQITMRFIDPATRLPIYVQNTAAMGPDNGRYVAQFEVEMVPSK